MSAAKMTASKRKLAAWADTRELDARMKALGPLTAESYAKMSLPAGWAYWESEDGRRVFNEMNPDGGIAPSGNFVMFKYNATAGPMTYQQVLDAIPSGNAERVVIEAARVVKEEAMSERRSARKWIALPFWLIGAGTVPIAIWFVLDTLRTFPNDSFINNLPGLVLFPGIILCEGLLSVACGFYWYEQ